VVQLLAGSGANTLNKSWYDEGGTAADVGDVTIGIIDGNGDTIIAAGTATINAGSGVYTYSLADQPNPDQLTVTWTDVDTTDTRIERREVVGNWLFTENQARTFHAKADATSALIPLASATEYTDAMIADERLRIQNDLEQWTGRSWVPRYCRLETSGNGSRTLPLSGFARTSDGYMLNREGRTNDVAQLLTLTVGGTAKTVGDYVLDPVAGNLVSTVGSFSTATASDPYNVVVEYVYGLSHLADGVDRIALKLLVDRLVPSAFPDRALSVDTDFGTTRFVQPGGPMNNVSRVPEVNSWITRHNYRVPVV